MTILTPRYRASLEAIAYQGQSVLFRDLTLAFEQLMLAEPEDRPQLVSKLNLPAIVKRHTGLLIDFVFVQDDYILEASAMTPIIDKNSPLLDAYKFHGNDGKVAIEIYTERFRRACRASQDLRGGIDLKEGRVSGVFSQLRGSIHMSSGMWKRVSLSADELAAVFLHELGHIFTHFEALVLTASTNLVLTTALQALKEDPNPEHRLHFVTEAAKALDVKIADPASLTQPNIDERVFASVFLKEQLGPMSRSALGSSKYDLRSSEFAADQFAARHGAARPLVMALDKLERQASFTYRSRSAHIVMEAVKAAFLITFAVGSVFTGLATLTTVVWLFVFSEGDTSTYDPPGERLARLKNDLVQSLKNPKLNKELKKQLLSDIDLIDALRADVKDQSTIFSAIWRTLSSARRDQRTQQLFQQDLEKIVNNDLFVKAAQLQQSS